jgi:hypothetical protein
MRKATVNIFRALWSPAIMAIGCMVEALPADAQIASQTAGLSAPALDLSALQLMESRET